MKRRELLRHLEAHGCLCARDTGPHSIWKHQANGKLQPVPHHTEIDTFVGRKIYRMLAIPDPPTR